MTGQSGMCDWRLSWLVRAPVISRGEALRKSSGKMLPVKATAERVGKISEESAFLGGQACVCRFRNKARFGAFRWLQLQ